MAINVLKDLNNKILNPHIPRYEQAFCQINNNLRETITEAKYYSNWTLAASSGGYTYDASNLGIKIPPGTRYVEVGGGISGSGNIYARLHVSEEGTRVIKDFQTLTHPNGLFSMPLSGGILELDPSKTYYVKLHLEPHGSDNFVVTGGFSADTMFLWAKRIK